MSAVTFFTQLGLSPLHNSRRGTQSYRRRRPVHCCFPRATNVQLRGALHRAAAQELACHPSGLSW